MKLLIIIPRQPHATGNYVSASRFAQSLSARGWRPAIIEVTESAPDPIDQALQERPDMVLLVHAYRSGRPWLLSRAATEIPYAVLMTGTDLNQDLQHPQRAGLLDQVLTGAAVVLVQNRLEFAMVQKSSYPWRYKLKHLPPGILLGADKYPLRQQLGLAADDFLMVHPASLRPVKGNLELLLMAAGLVERTPKLHLAFCGPLLEADYSARFLAAVKTQARARYLGEIPYAAMPDLLRQSDLVLNNSSSEGVPNALVEAACLGRPILARNIPGNCSVVQDGVNGLLFKDSAGFERQILRLLADPDLHQRLSRPDPLTFSAAVEAERLAAILAAALRLADVS